MERHPYIGLRATAVAYENPGHYRHEPEQSGIIVHVGTASEEHEDFAVHYPAVTLLLEGGTHYNVALYRIILDPAEARARLAK